RHRLTDERYRTCIRIGESEAAAQCRRLAGAVGAEESEAFAATDREVEAAQNFVAAVGLAQALHREHHPVRDTHRAHMPLIVRCSCGNRPWKKCPQPGKTMTGRCCGRAHSNTSRSATTSSSSPWMTIVSSGTCSPGNR